MNDCCKNNADPTSPRISQGVSRRAVLTRISGALGGAAALAALPAYAQSLGKKNIKLAFCSQLLCVVPYEITRAAGFFADQGLEVQLVYSRGGSAALQALHSGGVEYAATSFDAALGAYANGAQIFRFADTGRLPLFALATGPATANEITSIADLAGRTIGVAQLGNADHALALYLLKRAGVDVDSVQFATLGPNLYDALRIGQIDVGHLPRVGFIVRVQMQVTGVSEQFDPITTGFENVQERPLGDAVLVRACLDLDVVLAEHLRGVDVVLRDAVEHGNVVELAALAEGIAHARNLVAE